MMIAYFISTKMDEGRFLKKSLSVQSVQIITWKKVMDIDMGSGYNSAYSRRIAGTHEIFSTDFGCTRKLLKDRFRLRLYAI